MGTSHYTDGALHRTDLYRSHPGIAVHSHTWGLVEMVVGGGVSGWWVVVVSAFVGVSGVDKQFFTEDQWEVVCTAGI